MHVHFFFLSPFFTINHHGGRGRLRMYQRCCWLPAIQYAIVWSSEFECFFWCLLLLYLKNVNSKIFIKCIIFINALQNSQTIRQSRIRTSPTCSMTGLRTPNKGVYSLLMQNCCAHGAVVGSTYGGQDCWGGTVLHEENNHQGGLRCIHNPHTQISWIVFGDSRTFGVCHESSSCETPESSAV